MSSSTNVTLNQPFNLQSLLRLLVVFPFSVEITTDDGIKRKGKIQTKENEDGYFIHEEVDSSDYPFTLHRIDDNIRSMEIFTE